MLYRTRKERTLARSVAMLLLAFALWWSGLFGRFVELRSLAAAKIFTVNVVGDGADTNPGDGVCLTASGNCSLRAAIQESNAIAGTDNIYFNIPGTGVKTISPGSPLPDITSAVYIDGYTQTGASQNTLPTSDNAVLTIELNGLNSGDAFGLKILAGGCTVRGLVIRTFSEGQISLTTNGGNAIEGNFIGTNAAGTGPGACQAVPGAVTDGIDIFTGNNTIGGTTAAVRNIISGNCGSGIEIAGGNTNNILGNFIGTDLTGTVDVGNAFGGIYVLSSNNNIGGAAVGAGNVISGNGNPSVVGTGITLAGQSKSNVVQGNLIGTDVTGTVALSNTGEGIHLTNDASNNMIGGTSAGAGNLISANANHGLAFSADFGPILKSTGNTVQGNLIGTNIQGTAPLGNGQDGIYILQASSNTIGGTAPGARNLISGNAGRGIELLGENCLSNLVQGNFIGIDTNGTSAIGNLQSGVFINSSAKNNTIGGTVEAARNVISGNHQRGVEISDSGTTGNQVLSNFIGSDASGTGACANNQSGVLISGGAANNAIGGSGLPNIIAFNGDRGIRIAGSASTGNLVSNNSLFSNSDIGIDLGNDGVTPNDAGDADTGPNNLQNFPVVTSAVTDGSRTTFSVTLDSTPSTAFAIQFFANSSCDPSGNGEGKTFLGTLFASTLANGHLTSSANLGAVPAGQFVTATATDPNNNTSEFSQCFQVTQEPLPGFSVNDVTVTEGNFGITNAVFTVSLSSPSSNTVSVNFATSDITATAGSDYVSRSVGLIFGPGVTSGTVTVQVNGDTTVESTEDFAVTLSSPMNATLVRASGIGRITNDDAQASLQFSAPSYSVTEDCTSLSVVVTRTGDISLPVDVDYTTLNGTASDLSDFTFAAGTLHFAPNDISRGLNVLITEDSIVEGEETATIALSNPKGGAIIGSQATATLRILDDSTEPSTNAIDDTSLFVGQQYHDFLNRQADSAGQGFWGNNIDSCGADAACREVKRIDTSAAFYLSIEFQQTGFLVERTYQSAFNRRVLINEFLTETQTIGRNVVVGVGNWEQQLETNKVAYFNEVVTRPAFTSLFGSLSNAQYVDALNANTGGSLTTAERNALVSGLDGATETRATALRKVAENAAFVQREFNGAFVLMQYFGYLRRNPDEPGYQFWLGKLNQFNGDFRRADMVKAFIISTEYRSRFGQP